MTPKEMDDKLKEEFEKFNVTKENADKIIELFDEKEERVSQYARARFFEYLQNAKDHDETVVYSIARLLIDLNGIWLELLMELMIAKLCPGLIYDILSCMKSEERVKQMDTIVFLNDNMFGDRYDLSEFFFVVAHILQLHDDEPTDKYWVFDCPDDDEDDIDEEEDDDNDEDDDKYSDDVYYDYDW